MTRFEKYRKYRNEIYQNGNFNNSLFAYEESVLQYKKKIDKVNPNIIKLVKVSPINLINSIVDTSEINNFFPNELSNNFEIINEYKLHCVEKQKNELFFKINNLSIFSSDKKDFSSNWLMSDDLYKNFINIKNKNSDFLANNKNEFVKKELIKNFKTFSSSSISLNMLELKKYTLKKQFSFLNYGFLSSTIILILILFVFLISLIVVWTI